MDFVGREKELKALNACHASGKFEFAVLYGRRRIGKSTLLTRFLEGKRGIYWTAVETDTERNLALFSKAVLAASGLNTEGTFASWEAAFDQVASLASERLVLVIDEYPYLAESNRSISSILQLYCDTHFKRSKLMLVLCGSSMSFMENQVLGYQSPIYGRRTMQMKVEPFGYRDSALFVPRYSLEQKALVYGLTGGVPKYLELFSDTKSIQQNVIENYLTSTGYLYEEPLNLLKQELREPMKYNAIIEAVALGSSKLNEIATKTHQETSATSLYTSSLVSLGILRKEQAVGEERNKRKTLYSLADTMFRFWYRFVFTNSFSVLSGASEALYEREIEPMLPQFMGAIFETMCKEFLAAENAAGRLPFVLRQIGRWWNNAEEIDIVALGQKNEALFGECKFTKGKVGAEVYETLLTRAAIFGLPPQSEFFLFSKQGFAAPFAAKVKELRNVRLVGLKEMYGVC
jgi:AAA+ ATPase superfamily predicted ATPase